MSFVYLYLELAERVGFVPAAPAPINDLGLIGTAQTRQNDAKPEYQVQNRYSAAPRSHCRGSAEPDVTPRASWLGTNPAPGRSEGAGFQSQAAVGSAQCRTALGTWRHRPPCVEWPGTWSTK